MFVDNGDDHIEQGLCCLIMLFVSRMDVRISGIINLV